MPRKSNQGGNHQHARSSSSTSSSVPILMETQEISGIASAEELVGRLLARGLSNVVIGAALRMQDETIARWRKRPAVIQACKAETDRLCNDTAEMFNPLIPQALAVYNRYLDTPDDYGRDLTAAKDVFDRRLGKPIVRTQSDMRMDLHITLLSSGTEPAPALRSHIIDGQAVELVPDEEGGH